MDDRDSTVEAYDPSAYARGSVSGYSKDETESASCGTWERGHVSLLCLYSAQGTKNIAYHGIDGIDQDGGFEGGRPVECRWAEINFRATLELPDERGELAKREGHFTARIEGRRLEPLIRRIRVGKQVTVHPTGPTEGKVQIDRIEIRIIEPEGA